MQVQSPALISGLRIQRCRELWCRPAAEAPIQPLAWELPYAESGALKSKKKKKKRVDLTLPTYLLFKSPLLISSGLMVMKDTSFLS